jgi:1-acyl-sn-glycerol-3-phosphate acyltransferase
MTKTTTSPKPHSNVLHPELARLPRITPLRKIFRRAARALIRLAVGLLLRIELKGLENVPVSGPLLIVANHLGDADVFLGLAFTPREVDMLAKVELYDFPVLGKLMEAYGVIWVHRGQPDRRAIRAALQALSEGRAVGIAPEGRESTTGSLEEGTQGAAYLAIKAGVSILPVTFTGTENALIFPNLRRLKRSRVTLTVGKPFSLAEPADRQTSVQLGTQTIMLALASQLPPKYQGVYQVELEQPNGSG